MRRCGMRTTISEGLLPALDNCLDAILSGAPGMAEGRRAQPELDRELAPLLAVVRELIRSGERIGERLAPWRDGLPMMAHAGAPGDAFLNAGRWPGLN